MARVGACTLPFCVVNVRQLYLLTIYPCWRLSGMLKVFINFVLDSTTPCGVSVSRYVFSLHNEFLVIRKILDTIKKKLSFKFDRLYNFLTSM